MNARNDSDIEAFEEIVSRYSDRLFRFAFMRIGIRQTAEDIVQDVLLRLYTTMKEGSRIQNTENFLFRSISNACIDWLRRRRPPTLTLEEITELPEEADFDIDAEFRRISRLLDGLPLLQAETVRLRNYDGLTFHQIAELLGISEGTVKSRYRYALRHIREKLERENND